MENKMTDKKSKTVAVTPQKVDASTTDNVKPKDAIKNNSKITSSQGDLKNSISKTAVFSLLVALIAITGVVLSYYYVNQQQSEVIAALQKENNAALNDYQQRFKKALKAQQSHFTQQIQKTAQALNSSIEISRKKELATLSESVTHLQKSIQNRQPSDWLIHEAEYLIRLASRSLWMEKDTKATINLLKEADARLVELNAPFLLPVRQLIHEDINALEAMPQLATDYIVLTLMALSKDIPSLPLTHDNFDKNQDLEEDLSLSDNIDDWETNLSKSWKKFFNDFIRVRQRTGCVEPLMSPNEQLNLKNNLGLKVQLAIWAASQRKTDVYKQSLNNAELWLNEYFDMNATVNKKFVNDIIQLQQKMVNYDYPTDLSSLNAIRKVLKERTLVTKPVTNNTEQTKPTEKQLETTLEQEGKTTKAGEL